MSASLEVMAFHANGISARPDRQMEEIRHGGWLLALERALLALDAERDDVPRAARYSTSDSGVSENSSDPAQAGEDALPQSGPRNAHALAAAEYATDSGERQGAALRASGMFNSLDSVGNSSPWAGQPAGMVMQMFSGMEAGLRPVGRVPSAAGGDATVQVPIHPLSRGASALGWQANHLSPARQGETDSFEQPEQTPAQSDAFGAMRDMEPPASRQLHLYRADDGVHAWIRDAALADYHGYALARTLNGELHASGLKLTGLTLNGKKIEHLYPGEQGRKDAGFMADGMRDALPQPSFADKTQG